MARIIDYSTETKPISGDYFLVDNESSGTKKVPADDIVMKSDVDSTPTQGSSNAVSSGGVYGALHDTDTTLSQSGQAADAAAVGDEITSLQSAIGEIEPGLSDAAKAALLACFRNVAWATVGGEELYQNLYYALYLDARIVSISAIFTQGSRVITPTDSLNSLKQNLVVTATYYNGTTATITDYALSGELTAGTSVITAIYGGKTATFEVTVTGTDTALYNWNFKNSLVDSVSGATALTTATRDSSGLTFDAVNQYADLGAIYSKNRSYEIDIEYINTQAGGQGYYRRLFAFGENGAVTQWNTTSLLFSQNSSRAGWWWYLGSGWDTSAIGTGVAAVDKYNYFNGKTVKIYIDANGYGHIFAKTMRADDSTYIKVGESHTVLGDYTSGAHVYFGGSQNDGLADARITGFRVYEGEK